MKCLIVNWELNHIAESVKEEGGIVISGRNTNQLSIAKSLPMNIPTFMSPLHNHASDDSDDLLVSCFIYTREQVYL